MVGEGLGGGGGFGSVLGLWAIAGLGSANLCFSLSTVCKHEPKGCCLVLRCDPGAKVDAGRVGREASQRHDVWRRVAREVVRLLRPFFGLGNSERTGGQPFIFSLHGIEGRGVNGLARPAKVTTYQ